MKFQPLIIAAQERMDNILLSSIIHITEGLSEVASHHSIVIRMKLYILAIYLTSFKLASTAPILVSNTANFILNFSFFVP